MQKTKNILVIGEQNLFTTNIVQSLKKENWNNRTSWVSNILTNEHTEIKFSDLLDWQALIPKHDIIIFIAPFAHKHTTSINYQQHVKILEKTINFCIAYTIEKFIYIHTAYTYGLNTSKRTTSELDDFRLQYINSPYLENMYIARQLVVEQIEQKSLPAVIISPACIYGFGNNQQLLISDYYLQKQIKRRVQWCASGGDCFLSIRDLCSIIRQVISLTKTNTQSYLAPGEYLSYRSFLKFSSDYHNQYTFVIPAFVLYLIGCCCSFLFNIGFKNILFSRAWAVFLNAKKNYSGNKAKDNLNIKFNTVHQYLLRK